MPNIDIPIVTVSVSQPGAAPAEVSTQIVQPIESAVSDVSGVKHVTATATDGFASITIEFAIETNTDRALSDIKDAVGSVRGELPDSAMQPQVQRVGRHRPVDPDLCCERPQQVHRRVVLFRR